MFWLYTFLEKNPKPKQANPMNQEQYRLFQEILKYEEAFFSPTMKSV